ncbi:CTAG/Pcc1 family [Xylogone sp. PMI_703]|nr:CTAG/Pcc1 family [Xylogone sp. PMI_703]
MAAQIDSDFPCSLTIDLPLPTARLANSAMRALSVDEELSPLVRRSYSVIPTSVSAHSVVQDDETVVREEEATVLRTEYKATTNRMLRVAVNGFMESLGVVIGVMEELDVDVLGVEGEGK